MKCKADVKEGCKKVESARNALVPDRKIIDSLAFPNNSNAFYTLFYRLTVLCLATERGLASLIKKKKKRNGSGVVCDKFTRIPRNLKESPGILIWLIGIPRNPFWENPLESQNLEILKSHGISRNPKFRRIPVNSDSLSHAPQTHVKFSANPQLWKGNNQNKSKATHRPVPTHPQMIIASTKSYWLIPCRCAAIS